MIDIVGLLGRARINAVLITSKFAASVPDGTILINRHRGKRYAIMRWTDYAIFEQKYNEWNFQHPDKAFLERGFYPYIRGIPVMENEELVMEVLERGGAE